MKYPEIDPQTGRAINPEKFTKEEVQHAQQLWADQIGPNFQTGEDKVQLKKWHQQFRAWIMSRLFGK